jgi:acyl-CoA thioester hydrolase
MPNVHRLCLRVRYSETDPMGRVHHNVYLTYFEMGRTELMRRRGVTYADMERQGRFVAIAAIEVKYRAAARYDEELIIETWIEDVRGARVIFGNRALRRDPTGETLIAEAKVTGALLDSSGRPQRFTDEEAAFMLGDGTGR